MSTSTPRYTWSPTQNYHPVTAKPQHRIRQINWRMVVGIAMIIGVSNIFTYLFTDKETSAKVIHTVEDESLYLIEKAAPYISDLTAFEVKVRTVAHRLDIPPDWLMSVMYMESKFNPAIQNLRGSGATGLIQFMVPTVRELNDRLGTEYYMSDLRKMQAHEQMELVEAYLQTVRERYGDYNSLTDLYLGILYPKAIGQEFCYTLFANPKRAYKQNIGLDENHDGAVTVSDIDRRMKRMFPEAYLQRR